MDGPASGVGGRAEAVSRLCYAGESVVDAVPLSGGLVGVTTHRVLALTPGDSGPNVRAVDRHNVTDVAMAKAGNATHGLRALRYAVYAVALVGGSYLVDVSSVGEVDVPAGTGVGEVVSLALALTGLLALLDDAIRAAGIGVLLLALLSVGLYAYSRDRYLAIGVAGGDPLRVPASRSESAAVDRVRAAMEKASNRSDG